MLINLSNHPSEKWSEAQTTAAVSQYGEIIDLPFPAVDPNASENEIAKVADEYVRKVQQLANGTKASIHIMGEMTLTYALVGKLKSIGYMCVASTTLREVYEETPERKTIIFNFVRFRNY